MFPLPVGPQVEPADHQLNPVLKQLEHTEKKKAYVLGLSMKQFHDISLAKTIVFAIYYTNYC